jgi:pyruvate kinase
MQKRTRIVCTIGPASESEEMIRALIAEGMDVARINFSHCPYDEAEARMEKLLRIRKELNVPLATMLDTKGPEVRVGGFSGTLNLVKGDRFYIVSHTNDSPIPQSPFERIITTNLPDVHSLCQPGTRVLLQDGFVGAKVVSLDPSRKAILVEVEGDGKLREKAHLAIPGAKYPLPFLSEKDRQDIEFGVKNRFDYIALSFVRRAKDIEQVRKLVQEIDRNWPIRLVAKIEDKEALDNLDEIIATADGVMVARGDLGVEVDITKLPMLQKQIIEKCYRSGKPVIVATQMLESMTDKTYPTRAEVTDVANATHDLASAVMLSGETANGVHPPLVVNMMRRIVEEAEKGIDFEEASATNRDIIDRSDLNNIIAYGALTTARECGAKAIIVLTATGRSARGISKFRPELPIHAFTFDANVRHQLALAWGVIPHHFEDDGCSMGVLIPRILQYCAENGIAQKGEKVVLAAGLPLGEARTLNMLRVETVGEETGWKERRPTTHAVTAAEMEVNLFR